MKFLFQKKIWFFVLAALLCLPVLNIFAATPEDLKSEISEKNKSLSEINQKIDAAQKSLDETTAQSKTLSQELKKIDGSINQLNLNIKYSEINISKTELEIESLQYDINDTQQEIGLKKEAVAVLLRELQKKDSEEILVTLLKNQSIAESIDEANSIISINSSLSGEAKRLTELNTQLSVKLDDMSTKKQSLELENSNLRNRKSITEAQKNERQTLLSKTKNQEKTYQQLIDALEKEQDVISKQISDAEDALRVSFDPSLLPSKRSGVFAWPVKMARDGSGTSVISQHYGETSLSKLYKGKPHNGVDFGRLPIGSPVFAAADGTISAVDNNDKSSWAKYQYGKYIMIEHNNNLTSLYAHLSVQLVSKGVTVKRGDLIGYSGNTGLSTGPHLHFGVYWTPSIVFKSVTPARGLIPIGVTINPEEYL